MALGFVARRLYAERVVLLFAVREPDGQLSALAGLPELAVGGLEGPAAMDLLSSLAPGRLSLRRHPHHRRDRREPAGAGRAGPGAIVGPAGGCGGGPLARACFAEAFEISAATGNPGVVGTAGVSEVFELAWRGRETDTHRVAAAVTHEATEILRSGAVARHQAKALCPVMSRPTMSAWISAVPS